MYPKSSNRQMNGIKVLMTPKMSACLKLASQKSFSRRLDTVENDLQVTVGLKILTWHISHSGIENDKEKYKYK